VIQNHLEAARTTIARISLMLVLAAAPLTGYAQSGNGWFVPDQAKPNAAPAAKPGAATTGSRQPADTRATATGSGGGQAIAPPPIGPAEGMGPLVDQQAPLPPLQATLPPMPEIPSIPKGSPTPAAIVGILSVPDILRVSAAYQQADKELAARRNKINEDGQKEQNALRELGQTFANERAKLTPEQIRAREKEYADRVNDSRRAFSERARIVQEAGQYVMAQIERVIETVAQQVAASRGVNLVLNRAQVLGTTADFDLTPQVADVVNRILPTVVIPPDGVSPSTFNVPVAGPRVSAKPEAAPAAAKN
jgi:Skp family chaperone for outer membrane proteins